MASSTTKLINTNTMASASGATTSAVVATADVKVTMLQGDKQQDESEKLGYRFPQPVIDIWVTEKMKTLNESFNKMMDTEFMPSIDAESGNPTENLIAFEKWIYSAVMRLPDIKMKSNWKSNWDRVRDAYKIRERTVEKPTFSGEEAIKYWMGIASDSDSSAVRDYGLVEGESASTSSFDYDAMYSEDNYAKIMSYPKGNPDMYGASARIIWEIEGARKFVLSQFARIVGFDGALNAEWTSGNIFFKYKKGPTSDPANFRPIISQPVAVRMFHRVLAKRMYDYMIDRGFLDVTIQKGLRGVGDSVFENTMHAKTMLNHAHQAKRPIYCAMLDLKQAYGSISYPLMQYCLEKYGFEPALISYVMSYYHSMKVRIIVDGKLSDGDFSWDRGLLQGDNLANVLFLICFNSVLGRIQKEFGELGFSIRTEKTITTTIKGVLGIITDSTKTETIVDVQSCLMLAYVDDILFFTESFEAMTTVCNAFDKYLSVAGLSLNYDKSKWLAQVPAAAAISADSSVDVTVSEKLIIGSAEIYKLKDGETFTYLGSDMEFNGGQAITLDNYIKWLRRELEYIDELTYDVIGISPSKFFTSKTIHGRMKFMLYKMFVFRRTKWDFMRTIWSDASMDAIEAVEKEYIRMWVGYPLHFMLKQRRQRSAIVRESRCLNSTHSMMRLYAQLHYGYYTKETKALKERLDKLTTMTKKLDDEFNSSFAADYDEIEKL